MQPIRIAALSLLALAVSGCRAGSSQRVPMPSQETRIENAGWGRVYVLRESAGTSGQFPVRVFDNQVRIGELGPGHYLCWERVPGRSVLRCQFDRPDADRMEGLTENVADLDLEAGDVAYWLLETSTQKARPIMTRLSEEQGGSILADFDPALFVPSVK